MKKWSFFVVIIHLGCEEGMDLNGRLFVPHEGEFEISVGECGEQLKAGVGGSLARSGPAKKF